MYYALVFFPSRSLRLKGFRSLEQAKEAIIRAKKHGYVKKLGNKVPVWSNVQ